MLLDCILAHILFAFLTIIVVLLQWVLHAVKNFVFKNNKSPSEDDLKVARGKRLRKFFLVYVSYITLYLAGCLYYIYLTVPMNLWLPLQIGVILIGYFFIISIIIALNFDLKNQLYGNSFEFEIKFVNMIKAFFTLTGIPMEALDAFEKLLLTRGFETYLCREIRLIIRMLIICYSGIALTYKVYLIHGTLLAFYTYLVTEHLYISMGVYFFLVFTIRVIYLILRRLKNITIFGGVWIVYQSLFTFSFYFILCGLLTMYFLKFPFIVLVIGYIVSIYIYYFSFVLLLLILIHIV